MWHSIKSPSDVPADCELHLAVIEGGEVHALVFPCRRVGLAWVDAKTRRPVEVYPTHWREWVEDSK
jgi:hypothetical protein